MDREGSEVSASEHIPSNEDVADQIQKEWRFKVKRAPETVILRFGIVMATLTLLEILLIISNNVHCLGYWEFFLEKSSQYRDAFTQTRISRAAHLDSASLDQYSLWRGWVVPSFLAGSTYIVVSLLSLRHELYHWKPDLLKRYWRTSKASKIGHYLPQKWVDFVFHIYEDKHHKYVDKNIQRRTHVALEDSREFVKILRTVAFNILLSFITIFVFWICFLQTKIETVYITQLPRSHVPPIQGILWYLCNDFFYFYPHWIAHHPPTSDSFCYKILPRGFAKRLHGYFNKSHKLHHRTKANLGIAAWYCSPGEQILFNLFLALIGPFLTQLLADFFYIEHIWGTHLVTLYVWLMAASASSVLAHTGFRSFLNDPGKHDLHHEHAFNPRTAVNFGTMGVFDYLHGTGSEIPKADARAWREQRNRQAALWEASRRTEVALTREQMEVMKQPDHSGEWVDKNV